MEKPYASFGIEADRELSKVVCGHSHGPPVPQTPRVYGQRRTQCTKDLVAAALPPYCLIQDLCFSDTLRRQIAPQQQPGYGECEKHIHSCSTVAQRTRSAMRRQRLRIATEGQSAHSLQHKLGIIAWFPTAYSWPPCWRSNSAMSSWPFETAMCRGVRPLLFLALTSALLAISNSTTFVRPQ
jgi:hypothetical protein